MVQTQIQLTKKQSSTLREIVNQRNISFAELIRQGIDWYLHTCGTVSLEARCQRALQAAERFRSAVSDLSEQHDDYLAEVYAE